MASYKNIPLSVLSLGPVMSEGTNKSALNNLGDLAVATENLGFKRFWIAEHHSIPGVATAATSILIGHVAAKTKTMRIGSGGIMLPNHAPLIVAENFGTLSLLHDGRIDLGLGRAPGTDSHAAHAMRRDRTSGNFPDLVDELQRYFSPAVPGQKVQAVPGAGLDVPIWILGSSLWSAEFAAARGLPYVFAAHFAPQLLEEAVNIYRSQFQPSKVLKHPYFMVCVSVVAAETDEQAEFLSTTAKQKFLGLIRGKFPMVSPQPVDDMNPLWHPSEREAVNGFTGEMIVGGPETLKKKFDSLIHRTRPDEIMITTDMHNFVDLIKSYQIVRDLSGPGKPEDSDDAVNSRNHR